MKRPQYVFRPNLNEPQHRRAWALLQQVPPAKRKEFLVQSILVAEQTDRLEKSIRKVVREELQAVNKSFANSPSPRADQLRAKGELPSVRMELSDITAYLRRKVEPPKDRMPKMPVKIKRKEKTL